MPRIVVLAKPGRTEEQRSTLARKVTDAVVESFDVEPSTVTIIFADMHDELVAEGGVLKSAL
jgi:4-oxalocrotonate tautomerase